MSCEPVLERPCLRHGLRGCDRSPRPTHSWCTSQRVRACSLLKSSRALLPCRAQLGPSLMPEPLLLRTQVLICVIVSPRTPSSHLSSLRPVLLALPPGRHRIHHLPTSSAPPHPAPPPHPPPPPLPHYVASPGLPVLWTTGTRGGQGASLWGRAFAFRHARARG